MTTPEERENAKAAADAALERAEELRTRGKSLAEQWRQARKDNNFRLMLRELMKHGAAHG
jgi:hypothetical protein